jgi:hypothetical protein
MRPLRQFLLGIFLALPAVGQVEPLASAQGCPNPVVDATELSQYQVKSVSFDLPFDFLRFQRNLLANIDPPLFQRAGSPFRDGDVMKDARRVRDALHGDDSNGLGLPVNVTAVVARIENCRPTDSPKTLDLVYRAFSSKLPFFPIRAAESVKVESDDPVKGAGLDRKLPFSVVPTLDYNRQAKAEPGAALAFRKLGAVETLSLLGRASSNSRTFDGAFTGSSSPGRLWLRRVDWRTGYLYSDQPSENGRLKTNTGTGQLTALLRDLGSAGPMLRAGAAFEGGNLGSRFLPSQLPAGTLARANYTGIKLFSGLTWRGEAQTLSASYGVQFGSTGDGFSQGFRKHVGGLSYQFRLLPYPHTPHEFDINLTGGVIQNLGGLPVSERFFGGNRHAQFIAGDTWRLQSAPLIHSFAQNELSRAGGFQAGGEDFVSLNLTYAPVVWKKPLLPLELVNNSEFQNQVEGSLNTAEEVVRQAYFGRDPAMSQIAGMKNEHQALRKSVEDLLAQLQAAEDAPLGDLEDRLLECLDEVQAIIDNGDIEKMGDGNPSNAGVQINAMLRPKGRLDELRSCAADLRPLNIPALDTAFAALNAPEQTLRAVFVKFDADAATRRAASDMKFARHVLNRFFNEINIASISPVVLFDAARIGPRNTGESPFRYGIGGGIRFTLVSTVRFTVAYSANPNPRPNERHGAFVVSMNLVDLFY